MKIAAFGEGFFFNIFVKISSPGDDLTFQCINREDWAHAPPAREDFLAAAGIFMLFFDG